MFTKCTWDNTFGPVVQGCRSDFDFTMTFERIIFSITPACAFLAGSLLRVTIIIRRSKESHNRYPVLLTAKLVRYPDI